MPENLFKLNAKEYILPGTRACQGCGLSLGYRYALKALRENTIVTLPACCLCVLHGIYPTTPRVAWPVSRPSTKRIPP